jgi:exoenzyme U
MSETLAREDWVKRVLGITVPRSFTAPPPPKKQVRFAPIPANIPPPNNGGIALGRGRERSGAVVERPQPPDPSAFVGSGGKQIKIAKAPGGGVLYTAPPPPVGEITFSGGGGKGVALPGAVQALEKSGKLAEAKKISGASVGSMTAALLAAGISADDFTKIANDNATSKEILEGKKGVGKLELVTAMLGLGKCPLTGQGLEDVVRDVLDETLRKNMTKYLEDCASKGQKPDPKVVAIMNRLASNKAGPTFGELRTLSGFIPAIKEVSITGTYTTEYETKPDGKRGTKVKKGNDVPQLYVFDADNERDMEVAKAVHASASFPGAFKPFDLTLSSGLTVTFIDGGVMNNTPTSSSIGNDRQLDPMPQSRGITFVFEDEDGAADQMLKGKTTPAQGLVARLKNSVIGADNAGAEYGKNRSAANRPEELIKVPLQLTLPGKNGGKDRALDMRGTFNGTLNFAVDDDAKLGFQTLLREETDKQIAREDQPKTREFASDSQMFVAIPEADLRALAKQNYPGAAEAVTFRERVGEMIGKLHEAVAKATKKPGGRVADALQDKNAAMALDELDSLAGDDVDFQGYVGRELNRGGLDTLLDAVRKSGRGGKVMEATNVVTEAIKVQGFSDILLKQFVYPKMCKERTGGASIGTLLQMESLLRAARSTEDVNEAVDMGIAHYRNKPDHSVPRHGHKQFAKRLAAWKLQAAA